MSDISRFSGEQLALPYDRAVLADEALRSLYNTVQPGVRHVAAVGREEYEEIANTTQLGRQQTAARAQVGAPSAPLDVVSTRAQVEAFFSPATR